MLIFSMNLHKFDTNPDEFSCEAKPFCHYHQFIELTIKQGRNFRPCFIVMLVK